MRHVDPRSSNRPTDIPPDTASYRCALAHIKTKTPRNTKKEKKNKKKTKNNNVKIRKRERTEKSKKAGGKIWNFGSAPGKVVVG